MNEVRSEVIKQPTIPIQQIFESKRTAHRANSTIIPVIEPTDSLIRIGKSNRNRNMAVEIDNSVDENGKIPCDICGKRYTKKGMNIHKAIIIM